MIKYYRLINKTYGREIIFEPFGNCRNIGDVIKIDNTKEYKFPINDIHSVLEFYSQNSYFFEHFFEDITDEIRNNKINKIFK